MRRNPASCIAFALVSACLGIASTVAATSLSTLIDLDNNAASGCVVGTFPGADFELVTTVDTSLDPPLVTGLALNQCVGGSFSPFAGPNPFTQFVPPWPAGSDAGLDAIETYLPLQIAGIGSPSFAIHLGFFSGSRSAPDDVLFTIDGLPGGAPILVVAANAIRQIPTLSQWALLWLALLLLAAGSVTLQRGKSRKRLIAGLLLLAAGLGIAVAASPHRADGILSDWLGHDPIAIDVFPPADAPVNAEIRRAFATIENGTLFLRIDIDATPNLAPVANPDSATVSKNSGANTILVRANDTDAENDPFTILSVTQPANGTVAITNAGADLTYAPNANYCNNPPGNALDAFTYSLSPGGSTATVSVTVDCALFSGAASSQPLALSSGGQFLAVANPDNDSVSFFDLRGGANQLVATVAVQREPNGVTFSADSLHAYAANTISGTVSVIDVDLPNGIVNTPTTHIIVGTEPYGIVTSPNGTRLYVANARSNTISVINPATNTVIATIPAGIEPRGLALTNDGDNDDTDETLYVTSFLSVLVPGKTEGSDDAKQGVVTRISTATNTVVGTTLINPIADTGFKALGDALLRIPPGATFDFTTGAYPNQLNNIAIRGGFAYLPNTGASPNGPVRFDVNTQSLLAAINTTTNTDAGVTINMHQAVAAQTAVPKLFITQPWAMAFKRGADVGYVVSAASNIMVKVAVNPATGAPTVLADPTDATRVLQVPVGRNPRGIVINPTDTRAYVMNYVSRSVSVIDLTGAKEQVIATLQSAALPTPGTPEDTIHIGRELYNTSVGVFDPATPGGSPITGRMSANGWGSCAACHPRGLSDQVVWIFAAGPRRTIPQHADFDPVTPNTAMRILNWSANRDEQEDFENNIRLVSGGAGLIVTADGVTPEPGVTDLTPLANAGRTQLKVRNVGAWDALKAYVRSGIRAPISPVSKTDPDVIAGRALFISANCQSCHGGNQWTNGLLRFTPPPSPASVVNGQIVGELRQVGTFDPNFFNEVRANAAAPLGSDGFAPPSLLSAFAFERSALHNGAAPTFDDVLNNVTHRSAGTGGVDTLSNAADRAKVATFLRSIDAASVPIP